MAEYNGAIPVGVIDDKEILRINTRKENATWFLNNVFWNKGAHWETRVFIADANFCFLYAVS